MLEPIEGFELLEGGGSRAVGHAKPSAQQLRCHVDQELVDEIVFQQCTIEPRASFHVQLVDLPRGEVAHHRAEIDSAPATRPKLDGGAARFKLPAPLRVGIARVDPDLPWRLEQACIVRRLKSAIRDHKTPVEAFAILRHRFPAHPADTLRLWVGRFFRLWCRNQWKRERYAPSFHLDDENLDPKTWCRFPILSGGYATELKELESATGKS